MVNFVETISSGYRERTLENAGADLTLAFAVDFTTAGEIYTKNCVKANGKKYIGIDVNNTNISDRINPKIYKYLNGYKIETINIAGNGLYSLKNKFTQQECDEFTLNFLSIFLADILFWDQTIKLVRSGGQSGFDEAGIKAADKIGYPTLVLAPKGWKYRDINGIDISNEEKFKNRFL